MSRRTGNNPLLLACACLCAAFLCAQSAAAPQTELRGGIFIEAEDYDAAQEGEEGFASITMDEYASSGLVLYRFHHGYVTYHFTVPHDGEYVIWMRYGAPGETSINVTVDGGEPPRFAAVPVPATGGCYGFGVWRWMPLWQGFLTAGEHLLFVGSAALRPDCFFITPNLNQRPDDTLLKEVKWRMGPRLPELTHDRQITEHPKWLRTHIRVCYAHSEWNPKVTIEEWCKLAAENGANVIMSAGEIPAGMMNGEMKCLRVDTKELPEGYKVDYSWVKRYTDAAHAVGLKYVCYVNADRTLDPLLLEHPEWRQMQYGGRPRATWGCWNSPYRKAFIERLVKIAKESGFDGICIDMPFTAPRGGCRSEYCVRAFREKFGVEPPRRRNPRDPLWQRWMDFQSWTREEWLLDLTETLHAVNPEIAVIVNQTRGWIFNISDGSFLTTRVAKCVDGLLEEIGWEIEHNWRRPWAWKLQNAWQNLFLRCRARPGYAAMWHVTYNMPDVEVRAQALSMLANGTAPSVTTGGNWKQMKSIWQYIKKCEKWCIGAELIPWAAIHFSEDTLAWYANAQGEEITHAYMKNIFGVFQAMLEAHLPVEIITDDDLASLETLKRYKVLVLPNSACMSEEQAEAVRKYVEEGGGLLATYQTGMFDTYGTERDKPALESLFGIKQGRSGSGILWRVRIAERNHPILQNEVVASSGNWAQGLLEPAPYAYIYRGSTARKVGAVQISQPLDGTDVLLPMNGAWRRRRGALKPDKGWKYSGLVARNFSKGRVVYSPLDLGHAYFSFSHPLGRALIAESLKWAASEPPPIKVDAPMIVQTVFYRKGDAVVIHLLNDISSFGRSAAPNPEAFGGFRSEVIPIRDIRLELRGSFGKVHLEPSQETLPATIENGTTKVTVPLLKLHTLVVAEP